MNVKRPWQSKTNWVALLIVLLGFIPGVGDWISRNPEIASTLVGAVMALLRVITNGKIVLK